MDSDLYLIARIYKIGTIALLHLA